MNFKQVILSTLILFAYISANSQAVLDAGVASTSLEAGESLADKLMEESSAGPVYKNDYGFPPTPQKQREAEKNKTSMNWTMPSTLSDSGKSAKASRADAEASSNELANDVSSSTEDSTTDTSIAAQSESTPSETSAPSVGGSWSFTLIDNVQRDLILSVFQKGDNLFGSGKMREGNNTFDVTVSGNVQNETMDMDIISSGAIGLYRLNLDLGEDSAVGDYEAFYANGESLTGSAEGLKTA